MKTGLATLLILFASTCSAQSLFRQVAAEIDRKYPGDYRAKMATTRAALKWQDAVIHGAEWTPAAEWKSLHDSLAKSGYHVHAQGYT